MKSTSSTVRKSLPMTVNNFKESLMTNACLLVSQVSKLKGFPARGDTRLLITIYVLQKNYSSSL